MELFAGTSGYSYKEWKGSFYPEDLPDKEMLPFYSKRLSAVEINNTFYRLPKKEMLENWAIQVPEDFRFVLKASRKITHFKKLKDTDEETEYLFRTSRALGERLGVILMQLPPYLRKDLGLLQNFVQLIPDDIRVTFEFRHQSWFDDDVYDCLRARHCALCIADTDDDKSEAPLVSTANWGYLRLRRPDYDTNALQDWASKIESQPWQQVYVFFKHEDEGAGPRLAGEFVGMFRAAK